MNKIAFVFIIMKLTSASQIISQYEMTINIDINDIQQNAFAVVKADHKLLCLSECNRQDKCLSCAFYRNKETNYCNLYNQSISIQSKTTSNDILYNKKSK